MKTIAIMLIACLVIAALIGNAHSREKRNPALRPYRSWSEGELPELVDPGLRDLHASAAVDTYNIVRFDFEMHNWQGWTQVDNTAQVDTFFHVDDFNGLGGGDFGRLLPLEGSKSMWCGAAPNINDPYLSGWASPPGYGNYWKQFLATDSLAFDGILTISYIGSFDSEAEWDQTFIEYDAGEDNWVEVAMYEGVVSGTFTHQLILNQAATKLRFQFSSDGVNSDYDGIYNSDGACVIDSLVITDESGVIDYEDFEAASVGDHRTDGDGNGISWNAGIGESYGIYSGLASNLYQDKDPCGDNLGTQIVFFIGSPYPSTVYPGLYDTPYCKTCWLHDEPCQDEMVVSPIIDLTKYSTANDENQDTDIPSGDLNNLGGFLLIFTVYEDTPLTNYVFYNWKIRNIYEDGRHGPWRSDNYVYYGNNKVYRFHRHDIGSLIEADSIQVALRIFDYQCNIWWVPDWPHTPSPWFDNVRVQRYTSGPQWAYRDIDLFQDRFPTEGFGMEAYVRADAANDINSNETPVLRPGDSIVVTCTSHFGGGIAADPDGWPKVYLHVRTKYIGPDSPPHGPKPPLFGPQLAGTHGRYVSDDGSTWTVLQCDSARAAHAVAPDKYMVDLNDSLFTRGYMVEYYFSAMDNDGRTSYLPEDAPTEAGRTYHHHNMRAYDAVSYIFEFTCLPTLSSDILYVDDFHGRGTFWGTVEQYMNQSFLYLLEEENLPDRYDVNGPSSLAGNGLASSAEWNHLTEAYRIIIWDSGNLSRGTIGDGSTDSDKANDCGLLIDWMTLHSDSIGGAGLWILGDGVAKDLAGLYSPQALALMTTWCGVLEYSDPKWDSYYDFTGGFPSGTVTPLITGTASGIFYHTATADEWYAFGGCPSIKRFDCLTNATGAVIAAEYPDYGSHMNIGAAIQHVTSNASMAPIKTMWFGHSFMYIRDIDPGAPIIRDHIVADVLDWMSHTVWAGVDEQEIPKAYKLAQNFPNPFNPVTTIRFDVKERGHVSLKIYNVAGQLVKTLVDETRDASSYSIPWDGTNNLGTDVASGVYFYRMESGNFSKTRKMVLLR